jgi:hypothetical protein
VTSTPARGSALAPIRARLGAEHETIDVPALSRAGVSDDAGREQTRTDALTPAATAPAGPTYTPERAAGPTKPMAASAHGDAPGPGVDPTVTLRAPRAERPEATFAAREDSASVLGEDPRRAAPTHDAPQSAAEAPIAAPGSDEAEGRDAGSDPRGDERAAPTERRRERRGVTARGDDLEPRFEPTRAAEAPKAEGASAPPRGSDPSERTAEPMVAERSPPQASSVERGRAPSGGLDGTPALRAYAEPREDEGMPTGRVGARRAAITIGEGDERVTLAVDAAAGRVTVEATAHSPGVARALAEYRGELRDALRDLGLELGGFSASTGGGQPSPQRETRDERGAPERDDLRNPSSAALGEGAPRTTGGRRPGVRVVV